jgi:hypothetical protein
MNRASLSARVAKLEKAVYSLAAMGNRATVNVTYDDGVLTYGPDPRYGAPVINLTIDGPMPDPEAEPANLHRIY